MTGMVEQKVPYEMVCLVPVQGLVGPMGRQLLLNGVE